MRRRESYAAPVVVFRPRRARGTGAAPPAPAPERAEPAPRDPEQRREIARLFTGTHSRRDDGE
jgi:hypothetical protein